MKKTLWYLFIDTPGRRSHSSPIAGASPYSNLSRWGSPPALKGKSMPIPAYLREKMIREEMHHALPVERISVD